jgi:hypothetical protein
MEEKGRGRPRPFSAQVIEVAEIYIASVLKCAYGWCSRPKVKPASVVAA